MEKSKRLKVLSPIVNKETEKTYWARAGTAFINKDGSINVYLDLLPTNGRLHLRDWDEPDRRVSDGAGLGTMGPASYQAAPANPQLPF